MVLLENAKFKIIYCFGQEVLLQDHLGKLFTEVCGEEGSDPFAIDVNRTMTAFQVVAVKHGIPYTTF